MPLPDSDPSTASIAHSATEPPPQAASPTGKSPQPSRQTNRSVWPLRLLWVVVGLAVLVAASWVLVPPILKSQLEKRVSEQLGRAFTVGKIDFKPWALELELNDLALARADGAAPQIQIKRVFADASVQSARRLAPVLDALQIDGLDIKLTHLGNGKYDIDDILARLSQPPEKPVEPDAKPPGFALFNVVLKGANLDFTDKTVGKTHELRALDLTVPFLSNLDANREVKTEPRLAFRFNGSVFDSAAASTPFAQSHKTDATIKLSGFNLKPYLGYLPASLPVRLMAGVVDLDVKLAFEQSPRPAVKLTGTAQVKEVKVLDTAQQDLLRFDSLKADLQDVRPLEQRISLSRVALLAPRIEVVRDKAGALNVLLQTGPQPTGAAPKDGSPAKAETKSETKADDKAKVEANAESKPSAWQVEVAKIEVTDGGVSFSDETTQPGSRLALKNLKVEANGLVWPFVKPVQFSGATQVEDLRQTQAVKAGKGVKAAPSGRGAGNASGATGANHAADLKFDGSATDQAAQVNATIGNFALGLAAPYLAQFLEPGLAGTLATDLALDWTPQDLKLAVKHVTLSNLALVGAGGAEPLASLKKLEILDTRLDLTQQTVAIGKVTLSQPATSVERSADKHWMFERWLKAGEPEKVSRAAIAKKAEIAEKTPRASKADKAKQAAKPGAAEAATGGKAWAVSVRDILLEGGSFQFVDKALPKAVVLDISGVNASVKNYALDAKKPFPLALSFKLKQPQGEQGQLDYQGDFGLSPVSTQGKLTATQIPVHAFEPYFAGALNIELLRADVGFKGDVKYAEGGNNAPGQTIRVSGDAVLEEFRAHTLAGAATALATTSTSASPSASVSAPSAEAAKLAESAGLSISEELLTWKALSLRGLDVALAPGAPTTVTVAETALTDFFARVQIDPTGRFNLQDLVKPSSPASAPTQVPNSAPTQAPAQAAAHAPGSVTQIANAPNSVAVDGVSERPTASNGLEAVVNIGPISLINGKVFFSDHFIRPNYSANLSELNGRLSAFSSVAAPTTSAAPAASAPGAAIAASANAPAGLQMADLELRGRAEGTAALEILGKLNPLTKPLALDIKAKVRDLELPPLSPYSVKYAGHGIERGKLSVDLAYVVLPSGQLEAKNKIILNQLKFGDKVDGAPASLPVRLAVALLADRNGVIDLDLPVSGSLSDPQFRLGPIIFKIIVNVIVKAITAPFSLLASAFGGGGDELSQVAFAPGSANLGPEAKAGLDKVAKALLDRPSLNMTVVGLSNLEEEREGYKQERLRALLQAEKRRAQVVGGATKSEATPPPQGTASAPGPASQFATEVSEAEAPVLLKEVFRRSDVPKPRNVVGLVKDLPAEEMKALLLANIAVTDDAMRELALQRGVAVKDYLASKQLSVERLFLGNAKADAADKGTDKAAEKSAVSAKWTPRAELNLATN